MPRNPKDILNQRFGKLVVLSFAGYEDFGPRSDGTGRKSLSTWICVCDCGQESKQIGGQLTSAKTKSCGQCNSYGTNFSGEDLTGRVFGTYTVLDRAISASPRWKNSRSWNCRCECGKQIALQSSQLLLAQYPGCKTCKANKLPQGRGKLTPVKRVTSTTFVWRCECGGEITSKPGPNNCGCVVFNQLKRDHKHAAKKVYDQYIKDAEKRGKPFELTEDQFFNLITQPCHYTGLLPLKKIKTQLGDFFWNGVDRKDNSKGYTIDNCLPCSQHANWAKETRSYNDFIVWLKQVAKFWNDKEAAEYGF
jgi:hypothetical protein